MKIGIFLFIILSFFLTPQFSSLATAAKKNTTGSATKVNSHTPAANPSPTLPPSEPPGKSQNIFLLLVLFVVGYLAGGFSLHFYRHSTLPATLNLGLQKNPLSPKASSAVDDKAIALAASAATASANKAALDLATSAAASANKALSEAQAEHSNLSQTILSLQIQKNDLTSEIEKLKTMSNEEIKKHLIGETEGQVERLKDQESKLRFAVSFLETKRDEITVALHKMEENYKARQLTIKEELKSAQDEAQRIYEESFQKLTDQEAELLLRAQESKKS